MNIRLLCAWEKIWSYKLFDTISLQDQVVDSSTEFLLNQQGLHHNLLLTFEEQSMLLYNLNPPKMYNGTKPTIKSRMPQVLEATIMSEKFAGGNCFI